MDWMIAITPRIKIKRRHNRLIFIMFSGIIILTIYFIGYSYFTNINISKRAVLDKLQGIANTSAYMIDGDLHLKLSTQYPTKDAIRNNTDDTLYHRLHNTLENIKSINHLNSPVYTMVYNSESEEFEFIGTSAKHPYYRHMYQKFPASLLENLETGGVLNEYQSENGTWLSSFAPIRDKQGNAVALLQVDERFGDFIAAARIELLRNIVLALLIILPFTFLLFAYMKALLAKQEQNRQLLAAKSEEIQTQNEFIKDNNNKLAAAKLIIEQKNLELNTKVEERTSELKKANEELRSFLYRSSHDIQGPLTTLQGLCHLASNELKDNSSLAYIYMINDTTSKLYNTIKSINHVYEIKNKKIVNERIEIDPLIQKIAIQFDKQLKDKGISLITELEPNLIVKADRDIIIMALIEIFRNSIQFNSRLNGNTPYIKIIGHYEGNNVSLCIEDNGIGVNPDARELIFDMFQRGDENSKGVGLGLYAAKTGITKINGRISLSDIPKTGTRIDIRIPAA